MKKISLLALMLVSINVSAQTTLWEKIKMPFQPSMKEAGSTEYVTFIGNNVWLIKEEGNILLDYIYVTLNGTLIMPDGRIRFQSKKVSRMEEKDIISFYGIITRKEKLAEAVLIQDYPN